MFYFISGGPGNNIDYLTIKAYKILKKADVVFFHSLFDTTKLMDICKSSCLKISIRDMKINDRILYIKNNPEKLYVELMSGDVSLFSTSQEMIDILINENIDFEIIPGVSSISMASALIKNELVLPCISQCCIITYLENIPMIEKQSIQKLASHDATLVVLMAYTRNIDKLYTELINGGVSLDTPVAIIYKATYPDEKILKITVKDLPSLTLDLWHSVIIIGWVLANKEKRHEISGLPFVTNFFKAENFKKENL